MTKKEKFFTNNCFYCASFAFHLMLVCLVFGEVTNRVEARARQAFFVCLECALVDDTRERY
jgi:hypothetical protein